MAPPTALTLADAEPILRQYPLRAHALVPLCAGTINSNYRLETDCGPLFMRINEGKTEAEVHFEAALIWHLGGRGFSTPQLWRSRRGEPYVSLPASVRSPGKLVMLMQWIEGVSLYEEEIDEGPAREIGAALAKLHLASQGFPRSRPGIYTLSHIAARTEGLRREPRIPDGTVEFLGREVARLLTRRHRDLPRGLGHNDLFPDNVLFSGRRRPRLICVLDLEQVADLPYAYDLAVALLSFCAAPPSGESVGSERIGPLLLAPARALVAAYGERRPLLAAERRGLYEELRFAALRFTVTRLTDVHLKRSAAAPRPRAEGRVHSKDYRDFLRRLEALQAIDAPQLADALFG